MTSERPVAPLEAYVWVWLPGQTRPVAAGRLATTEGETNFVYARTYRARKDAISLYLPELPLRDGLIRPPAGLQIAGAIRDAAPDSWGRRIILNRIFGSKGRDFDLDELTFLMQSGSDRIGALDVQTSATDYVVRGNGDASLAELLAAAERVEGNLPLSPDLAQALYHGTSIGGARPKAPVDDGPKKYVAKFSGSTDTYSVVKGEYIAMRLAAIAGLDVACVRIVRVAGKDVLLVERFDRVPVAAGWSRKAMVSALTILGLVEMQARYASYQDLAEIVRFRFTRPRETLREMFSRVCFNILVGNVDDHARNHAAFWDGGQLTLTPAYDICPQARAGEEASQAMLIVDQNRSSRLATCLAAARHFHLDEAAAIAVMERQVRAIGEHWAAVCREADLGQVDRALFWGRQFLNPYAFYGLEGAAAHLAALATRFRSSLT